MGGNHAAGFAVGNEAGTCRVTVERGFPRDGFIGFGAIKIVHGVLRTMEWNRRGTSLWSGPRGIDRSGIAAVDRPVLREPYLYDSHRE